jgi:hypothetical protein
MRTGRKFQGVCGICGWRARELRSVVFSLQTVNWHVSKEHPDAEGFVGFCDVLEAET